MMATISYDFHKNQVTKSSASVSWFSCSATLVSISAVC